MFSNGFKTLTKTFCFFSCSSTLPLTQQLAGSEGTFPQMTFVIPLLFGHRKHHTPVLVNMATNLTTQWWLVHTDKPNTIITWMCIGNFLRVAVRAQDNLPEVWYLKRMTVLSHHGTMKHFPYRKDWIGCDCRLGMFFKPVGEAEWGSSKPFKQETKAYFTSYEVKLRGWTNRKEWELLLNRVA